MFFWGVSLKNESGWPLPTFSYPKTWWIRTRWWLHIFVLFFSPLPGDDDSIVVPSELIYGGTPEKESSDSKWIIPCLSDFHGGLWSRLHLGDTFFWSFSNTPNVGVVGIGKPSVNQQKTCFVVMEGRRFEHSYRNHRHWTRIDTQNDALIVEAGDTCSNHPWFF